MKRYLAAIACAFVIALGYTIANADINYTQGAGTVIFDFTCFTTKHCSAHTPINSAGTEIFTTSAPGQVGAPASAFADGSDVTKGAKADAACGSDNGTCSLLALIKRVAQNITTLNTTAGGAVPAGTNYIGQVGLNAATSGGWTPSFFIAAATNNSTNLKASAGIVHALQVYGVGSAPAYLKLYDKATAPTCGTDTPVKVIMIPAAATAANGAGAIATVIDAQFSTGIGYCVVTGITTADNTAPAASTFAVNIDWK